MSADFFYAHAGYSYQPATETQEEGRRRCAEKLAAAERAFLADADAEFYTEDSSIPWDGDCEQGGTHLLDAVLTISGDVVQSLGCIDCNGPSDPYIRVVRAELYGELLYERAADARMRRKRLRTGRRAT